MNDHDIACVVAAYDTAVRANTTPDYDARGAVANDADGEVRLEVIETAEQLGYSPTDVDVRELLAAADAYSAQLAAELADETSGPEVTE